MGHGVFEMLLVLLHRQDKDLDLRESFPDLLNGLIPSRLGMERSMMTRSHLPASKRDNNSSPSRLCDHFKGRIFLNEILQARPEDLMIVRQYYFANKTHAYSFGVTGTFNKIVVPCRGQR